ncbi:hypothetical protein ACX0MV_06935 [Pseudomonas borbori]
MKFLSPTKTKLTTTLLLIMLWFTYSGFSSVAKNAYKAYSLEIMQLSNYSKDIEIPTKEYVLATQSAREKITIEVVRKLEIAGYFNISAQLIMGLLVAYFGSCLIHRKKSSEHV